MTWIIEFRGNKAKNLDQNQEVSAEQTDVNQEPVGSSRKTVPLEWWAQNEGILTHGNVTGEIQRWSLK